MENATKALIMAASVLLGIMIIAVAAYMFSEFGEFVSQYEQQQEMQQIAVFNSKFIVYEGRTDLTAQDVVSIANLAKQNNEDYGYNSEGLKDGPYYISVAIDKMNYRLEQENDDYYYTFMNKYLQPLKDNKNQYIKDSEGNLKFATFTCRQIEISEETKRVKSVILELNKN